MKEYEESYKVVRQFAEAGAKAKTVSSWYKKKIPVELREHWYKQMVVRGIADYNRRCEEWLKENVK